jgi:hypothetical protein
MRRGASNQSTSEYFTGPPSLKMGVQSPAVNLSTWQGSSPFCIPFGRFPKRDLCLRVCPDNRLQAPVAAYPSVRPSVPFHVAAPVLRPLV